MRKISIKTKLMFIAILFILYPIIIIGYFGYRNYSDVMKEKAISDSQSTARELSGYLSERMDRLKLFAVQIFYDRTIYEAYNSCISGKMNSFSQNTFQQYLQSTLFSKYELNEILIRFNQDDKIFQANRSREATTESLRNIDTLHEAAISGRGTPVWCVIRKDGKVNGIYIAKIIYDFQHIKEETGLLVFKVNEQYLNEVFNNFISHSNQNVWLYSNNLEPIFSHEAFKTDFEKPVTDILDFSSDSSVKEISLQDDKIFMLYDTVEPYGWKLVIGISSNILLQSIRDIAKFILLLCIATLPICILLIDYLYMDMIKPLNLLIKKMHQVESGHIGVEIESRREDEFGYVFRTFNTMSLNIKNLINTVYKKQIAMKDAEIKALQAQINPHFLYNTLEAINWKARINGVDEISDMISAFSNIIDANLNRNSEKFIPIRREIEYIKDYSFLIQKRFGKKISFDISAEEDTMDVIIPKLLIQPIIENSVYHGLEMKKGQGTVSINIRKQSDILSINVSDNGLGIGEDILRHLNEEINNQDFLEKSTSSSDEAQIGVLNVHRRIQLLYGKDYGLIIRSKTGEGTSIAINLPATIHEGSEEFVQSLNR